MPTMGRLENKLARAILSKDAKTVKKLTGTKPVANVIPIAVASSFSRCDAIVATP